MATTFSFNQSFPADPAAVFAMLRDPEYVRTRAESTGGHDVAVDVVDSADGGVTVTCTRSMPADVPSYAKSFVGDTLTVTEVQVWGPAEDDGSATAQVTVDFHAPISYRGTIELTPTVEGSAMNNEGEFKAGVPLVGGKVERVAAEQTERYLTKEMAVAAEWLA